MAQSDEQLVRKGNELYKKKQYEAAAKEYRRATELNDKNAKAYYNLGSALHRSNKTAEAEKAFGEAAKNAKDAMLKSKALYNEGVTLSKQRKLAESIDAYKQALRLNSKDEQARENLQLALNELKKEPPPKQNESNNNQNKQDNKKQPEQQKNNSKLNKQQAEQMLSTLRNEEKRLQQSTGKKNNLSGSNSKDW